MWQSQTMSATINRPVPTLNLFISIWTGNFRELYPKKNIEIDIDLHKNDNSSRPSKRVKRSESYNNTVELMIAADKKMLDYHGDGLEQYVLTLVAVVSK